MNEHQAVVIPSSPEAYAPSILIIDDDPQIPGLCREILKGYLVTEASSGREALATLQTRFFDLLVLDLVLPDMDGFELLRTIHVELPRIKVIVMSGFMRGGIPIVASHYGATATLAKPFSPDSLLSVVCQVLGAAPTDG